MVSFKLFVPIFIVGCLAANIQCSPSESVTEQSENNQQLPQQIAVPLPAIIQADVPAGNPNESVVAVVPISLLDIEPASESTNEELSQRSARGLGGLGGLGKFGGLGLGFKGFGGFQSFGLGGGLHGLGGGFGGLGFKPFFGKHFG